MPLSTVYIKHAIEQEVEQSAWEVWKEMYPWMAAGWLKNISFKDFKAEIIKKPQKYSKKTNNEILSEMSAIVQAYKGR